MFPGRRFTKEYPTHCRVALCENHMPVKQDAKTRKKTTATLPALQPKQHLSDEVYDKIAAVHNSSGQAKCRAKLNYPSVTDRMINTFIRQCPCCQVQIKTHPFVAYTTN